MKLRRDQVGALSPVLIILVVVVLGVAGFAGFKVYDNNKNKNSSSSSSESSTNKAVTEAVNTECVNHYKDKDFCKFASNWDLAKKYKIVFSTKEADGTTSNTTMEVDGDNSSMVSSQNGKEAYAFITLNKVSYMKDYTAGVWYKMPQSTTDDTKQDTVPTTKLDFSTKEKEAEDKSTVKSLGKEACGNQTCFKYEVIDPADKSTKQNLIWFDDKDYKLVRMQITGTDGSVNDSTFSYPDNIKITEPSPVKDYPTIDPSALSQ